MGFYCVICSDSLVKTPADDVQNVGQEAKVSATPCGHFFHHFCITKWLKGTLATSKQCPCCRKDVPRGRCLPLFPTILEDSIVDDSSPSPVAPCNHEPQLRGLRCKIENLELKCSELEMILQSTTKDLESERSKLMMEKKRSDKYMIQCQKKESLQFYADDLEAKLDKANMELKSLQVIQQCVESSRIECEEELANWPTTKDSIKCLVDAKVVLTKEVRMQVAKTKEINQEKERIRVAKVELTRQCQKLKNENEQFKDENARLKIELEQLNNRLSSSMNSNSGDKASSSILRRKRKSDEENPTNLINIHDSVSILSPGVDADIPILEPFHKSNKLTQQRCKNKRNKLFHT